MIIPLKGFISLNSGLRRKTQHDAVKFICRMKMQNCYTNIFHRAEFHVGYILPGRIRIGLKTALALRPQACIKGDPALLSGHAGQPVF